MSGISVFDCLVTCVILRDFGVSVKSHFFLSLSRPCRAGRNPVALDESNLSENIFLMLSSSITECVASVRMHVRHWCCQVYRMTSEGKGCSRMNVRDLLHSNIAVTPLCSPLPRSMHCASLNMSLV